MTDNAVQSWAAAGLQNATFGNVVELILSIVALTKGLFVVVAMSLLGSVLSNLLLVLGKLSPSPCPLQDVCMLAFRFIAMA